VSGRTYITKSGGSIFFPILTTPTGEIVIRTLAAELGQGRGLIMPRRAMPSKPAMALRRTRKAPTIDGADEPPPF
jgi:hypothetical protein